MPPEIRTEIRRTGRVTFGRTTLYQEREVTIVTDLRDTPFGQYDFGTVTHGPVRWVSVKDVPPSSINIRTGVIRRDSTPD